MELASLADAVGAGGDPAVCDGRGRCDAAGHASAHETGDIDGWNGGADGLPRGTGVQIQQWAESDARPSLIGAVHVDLAPVDDLAPRAFPHLGPGKALPWTR